MKMKSVVLVALALGSGLVAMFTVKSAMSKGEGGKADAYAQVLVTITDVQPGVPLSEANVAFKKWPADAVPEGAVTQPEEWIERSLKGTAVAGEVVMLAKLNEPGVFGASSEIEPGMRVVTVSVDATKTHSGLIQPGDRVDVLCTYKTRSQAGMVNRTKTVLEFIKVFATDNRRASVATAEVDVNAAKNISLMVDPDQANLLMLAQSKGPLHLALRHKKDSLSVLSESVDDSIFEDVQASAGTPDENLGEFSAPAGAEDGEEALSVQEALQRELAMQTGMTSNPFTPPGVPEPQVAAAVEPVVPVEPETWKVEIYSGNEVRIEEVDLPENPSEADMPKVSAGE